MGAKQWTAAEDQKLREVCDKGENLFLHVAAFPGRTVNGLRARAARLGIQLVDWREWTDEELEKIDLVIASRRTVKACAHMFPGRTVLAVKQKIAYLGKRKTRGHDSWVWDAIERELKANPGLTGRQLERKIGCCYRQVMDQLYLHTREFPKAVRVSAWVRSCPTNKSPGPWVQCWALGSEADAPKPSPMSKEDRQRRSRVAHRKPSTRRINPFATVTGLVSAPTGQPGRVYHHLVDDDREAA